LSWQLLRKGYQFRYFFMGLLSNYNKKTILLLKNIKK